MVAGLDRREAGRPAGLDAHHGLQPAADVLDAPALGVVDAHQRLGREREHDRVDVVDREARGRRAPPAARVQHLDVGRPRSRGRAEPRLAHTDRRHRARPCPGHAPPAPRRRRSGTGPAKPVVICASARGARTWPSARRGPGGRPRGPCAAGRRTAPPAHGCPRRVHRTGALPSVPRARARSASPARAEPERRVGEQLGVRRVVVQRARRRSRRRVARCPRGRRRPARRAAGAAARRGRARPRGRSRRTSRRRRARRSARTRPARSSTSEKAPSICGGTSSAPQRGGDERRGRHVGLRRSPWFGAATRGRRRRGLLRSPACDRRCWACMAAAAIGTADLRRARRTGPPTRRSAACVRRPRSRTPCPTTITSSRSWVPESDLHVGRARARAPASSRR